MRLTTAVVMRAQDAVALSEILIRAARYANIADDAGQAWGKTPLPNETLDLGSGGSGNTEVTTLGGSSSVREDTKTTVADTKCSKRTPATPDDILQHKRE